VVCAACNVQTEVSARSRPSRLPSAWRMVVHPMYAGDMGKERSCLLCGVSRCSEDGKNIRIVDGEESPFAGILIAFRCGGYAFP